MTNFTFPLDTCAYDICHWNWWVRPTPILASLPQPLGFCKLLVVPSLGIIENIYRNCTKVQWHLHFKSVFVLQCFWNPVSNNFCLHWWQKMWDKEICSGSQLSYGQFIRFKLYRWKRNVWDSHCDKIGWTLYIPLSFFPIHAAAPISGI